MWQGLGELLGVHVGTIKRLSSSTCDDLLKMSDILQNWLDNEPTPVTWNNIIGIIEGPLQNKRFANEIRQKVKSSKYCSTDQSILLINFSKNYCVCKL